METNRDEIRTLLHRELDRDLAPAEARRLEALCRQEPALAAERRELRDLSHLLASDRIEARPGFDRTVLSALPEQPRWARAEGRSRWLFPLAVAVLLLSGTLLLLGGATGEPIPGLLVSVAEFFGSSILAGAGLLGASWTGVGMIVGELLEGPGWIAFGLGVLALDILLLKLLRQGGSSAAREATRDE